MLTGQASHIHTRSDVSFLPQQMACYHFRYPDATQALALFCRQARPHSSSDWGIGYSGEIGQQSEAFGSRPDSLHPEYQFVAAALNAGRRSLIDFHARPVGDQRIGIPMQILRSRRNKRQRLSSLDYRVQLVLWSPAILLAYRSPKEDCMLK